MAKPLSEQAAEDVVIAQLAKAGYLPRQTSAYDKSLCSDAGPLIDFIQTTLSITTRMRKRGTTSFDLQSLAYASGWNGEDIDE